MNDGGAEWERERAIQAIRAWLEINQAQTANIPGLVDDLITALGSLASAQAASSTVMLSKQIEALQVEVQTLQQRIEALERR